MSLKKLVLIFGLLLIAVSISPISDKSYKNLTDRDRILLSISYYEVSQKYAKAGKSKLSQSYRAEAIKIEKDVKKYVSGELEVPKKSININLQDIFKGDDSKENNKNTTTTTEKKK